MWEPEGVWQAKKDVQIIIITQSIDKNNILFINKPNNNVKCATIEIWNY